MSEILLLSSWRTATLNKFRFHLFKCNYSSRLWLVPFFFLDQDLNNSLSEQLLQILPYAVCHRRSAI